jgi:hypothetical protein
MSVAPPHPTSKATEPAAVASHSDAARGGRGKTPMANENEKKSRGSGMARERQSGSKKGNQGTQRRQLIGRGRSSRAERFVSQQVGTDADQDGPSRQTSTAQDELGQV